MVFNLSLDAGIKAVNYKEKNKTANIETFSNNFLHYHYLIITLLFLIILFPCVFDGAAYAAQSFSLKRGFNFICFTGSALPGVSEFKALSSSIEDVYTYSAAAGSFLSVSDGSLTSLSAGRGYIVKSSSASPVTISVSGGALSPAGNISLKAGFNLVGFSKMPETLTTSALMTRGPKIKGVYKWSAAAGSFIQIIRNASGAIDMLDGSDPALIAGESYFINLSEDQQLNYDGATVMIDTSITPPPTPVSGMKFLSKFGSRGAGAGQFAQGPISVAVDAAGNILASDTYNHRVHKFSPAGVYISSFGSQGLDYGKFSYPTGVVSGKNGYVYVVDYGNARVQRFDAAGNFLSSFGSRGTGNGQFQKPDCVAVDSAGNVHVSDFGNNNIQKFSYMGSFISKFGGAGNGNGLFGPDSPKDIAVSPSGKIYAADLGNNRVQVFNSTGAYESQWGAFGTGAGQFDRPHGVAVDVAGDIFVSDKNCRVQKFSPAGAFILSVGGKGTLDGQFEDPSGVFADNSGNLLAADFGNARVQIFGSGAPIPGGDTLSEIILSKASDGATAGSSYSFTRITVTAKYTSGKTTAVTAAWSIKSGGGSIIQDNYMAPLTGGFSILTASYTENGVTKTAELLLAVNTASGGEVFVKDMAAASDNLTVIDKRCEAYIASVDSSKVVFNADAPAVKTLSPGRVIIGGVSTAAPDGFIRKVVSVVSSGSTSVVNTAPASLEESFSGGAFAFGREFSPADVNKFEPYLTGVELGPVPAAADYRSFSPDRAGTVTFNFPSLKINTEVDMSEFMAGLKLGVEGTIALQPSVDYDFNFTGGTKIKIIPKLKTAAALTYNLSKGVEAKDKTVITKKARLGKFHLAKTVIWVPTPAGGLPVPIVLTSDLVIYSVIKGSVSGGFSLTINAAVETENGFEYNNGSVTPRFARTFSGSVSTVFKAGYELESSMGAEIGIYLYGVAGPAVTLELYQQTSGGLQLAAYSATDFYKWWSDAAGVRSAIAGKFDMFARTYDVSLNLFDIKGYEKSSPVLKSLVLEPFSASLTTSNAYDLKNIKVYGVYDNKWVDFFVNKSFDSTTETNLNLVAASYLLIKYRTDWNIISGGGSIGVFDKTYRRTTASSEPAVIEASFYELTKDGMNTKTARLTLNPSSKVSTPLFKTTGDPSSGPQTITLSCATAGASVRYTTDGVTVPTSTTGVIYSGPFTISKTTNIKVVAYKSGMTDSSVVSYTFTVNVVEKVAAPVIDPAAGTFPSAQSVKITCTTAGAIIRYTSDGTNPTITNGFNYSAPITVDSVKTIKAYAYKDGMTDSDMVSAVINVVVTKVATPVLNPTGGSFAAAKTVALSCATAGASMMYTTDGSNPSASNGFGYSPVASPAGITIDKTCTLKVIAIKSGMTNSDIASAYFVISGSSSTKVATPVIIAGGTSSSTSRSVTISCPTAGATIKYTTNGTTPSSANGTIYSGAFTLSSTATVKAIAIKSGMTNSDVASSAITVASGASTVSGIALRPSSASTNVGSGIRLDYIDLLVNYSNGTSMETSTSLTRAWTKISGSGSFSTHDFYGYIYAPSTAGTHVLRFTYTSGGVSKTADLTITVN
jgi:hypothetical protein